MIENIVLGAIQGISEWLPVSSEGMLVLSQIYLIGSQVSIREMLQVALFLHFGTFLAALLYFRREVLNLFSVLINYKNATQSNKRLFTFLFITTIISGIFGLLFLQSVDVLDSYITVAGKAITFFVGLLLIGTGFLQMKAKNTGNRKNKDITIQDGMILGLTQGFAVLPGFSRSGLTVSVLLLLGFEKKEALRLSFLMSLPIVFMGNIALNISYVSFNHELLAGLLTSFILGFATIHFLLTLARKINFGYFVLIFGLLTIISVFI